MNWFAVKIFFYLCQKENKVINEIDYARSVLVNQSIPADVLEAVIPIKKDKEKQLQRIVSLKQIFVW